MSDKVREEFEAWYKLNHTKNVQIIDGEYVHGATERLWKAWKEAWKASRAALVVELPVSRVVNLTEVRYLELIQVKNALTAAGINYK